MQDTTNDKPVSPAILAARARVAAAKAKADAVKLTDEEAEIARLRDEEEAAEAEARAAMATRRRNTLKDREERAREAASKLPRSEQYIVRGVDLADHLPAEVDLKEVPNEGLWVVRSPSRMASRRMNADMEDKSKHQDLWVADLVAACVVDPDTEGESGIVLRQFIDDEKFLGAMVQVANVITDLNGTKRKEAKRGHG